MTTVDDFLATATPRTETVRVCARNDLVARHLELTAALRDALAATPSDALATDPSVTAEAELLATQVVEVEAEMEMSTLEVTLTGIGAKAWADLLRQHPPDRQKHRGYAHNPDTFPPAAVAACATDPMISETQAVTMFATLASAEWTKLWVAVVGLNELETPHPKLVAATDLLRARQPSAASPGNEGSPGQPSSAGSGAP